MNGINNNTGGLIMENEVKVTNLDEIGYYVGNYDRELTDIKNYLKSIKDILEDIKRQQQKRVI